MEKIPSLAEQMGVTDFDFEDLKKKASELPEMTVDGLKKFVDAGFGTVTKMKTPMKTGDKRKPNQANKKKEPVVKKPKVKNHKYLFNFLIFVFRSRENKQLQQLPMLQKTRLKLQQLLMQLQPKLQLVMKQKLWFKQMNQLRLFKQLMMMLLKHHLLPSNQQQMQPKHPQQQRQQQVTLRQHQQRQQHQQNHLVRVVIVDVVEAVVADAVVAADEEVVDAECNFFCLEKIGQIEAGGTRNFAYAKSRNVGASWVMRP